MYTSSLKAYSAHLKYNGFHFAMCNSPLRPKHCFANATRPNLSLSLKPSCLIHWFDTTAASWQFKPHFPGCFRIRAVPEIGVWSSHAHPHAHARNREYFRVGFSSPAFLSSCSLFLPASSLRSPSFI